MAELEALAQRHGAPILEDACQALGAAHSEGSRVGARGNPATFAFYPNKQMTTGEGGVLVPSGAESAELVRSERNQGRAADMGAMDHARLGFNYRLSDVAAAIGVAQLEHLDEMLVARARVAGRYGQRLAALEGAPAGEGDPDGLVLPCNDRGRERRSWFVYVVQLPGDANRDGVIEALADLGIQSKAYLPCIHLMPYYRERFGFKGGEFPVAERVGERSLALPLFPAMKEEQVERVCGALRQALRR
jgi:perosamine synthetase